MRIGLALGAVLGLLVSTGRAEGIVSARYEAPVDRYGHFALGRPHEYARVLARTDAGRTVALELPDDEVFEDLAPRLVQLTEDGPTLLLTIVSERGVGARLVLIGLQGDALEVAAQSASIGTPNRWLNPVGVADPSSSCHGPRGSTAACSCWCPTCHAAASASSRSRAIGSSRPATASSTRRSPDPTRCVRAKRA